MTQHDLKQRRDLGLTGSFNITFPQPQFCLMAWWSGEKITCNLALDLASLGSSNRSTEVKKYAQLQLL